MSLGHGSVQSSIEREALEQIDFIANLNRLDAWVSGLRISGFGRWGCWVAGFAGCWLRDSALRVSQVGCSLLGLVQGALAAKQSIP